MNKVDGTTTIRCFDLGGSGLKTALVSYNEKTRKMTIVSSAVINLGMCPNDKKVSEWVREQLQQKVGVNLDKEVDADYRFGFSLAGLDKLCEKGVETDNMAHLFKLPSDKTASIDDGAAHLKASLHHLEGKLPEGRVWNFSIGTGVGFGFTNSKKEIKPLGDLKVFFGKNPWSVQEPTTGKDIWEAGSSKHGFDQLVQTLGAVSEKAFKVFAGRWREFIEQQIIDRCKTEDKEWAKPAAVVFTGGHLDYHGDQLVRQLNETGLKVKVFVGPREAGILGSAWTAMGK